MLARTLAVSLLCAGCDRARSLNNPPDGATAHNDASTSCATSAAPVAMPTAEFSAAAATGADGRIYVLGGVTAFESPNTKSAWAYAPSTGVWTPLPDMPSNMHTQIAAASIGQTIYALGDQLFAFDLASQTWSTKSAGPDGTYAAGSDGKIYATGQTVDQPATAPERYDPATDRWTSIANETGLDDEQLGASLGDMFYVVGTANAGYDFVSGTWNKLHAPSAPRYTAVGSALGQHILLAGGFPPNSAPGATLATAELYDPTTDSWSPAEPLPVPVAQAAGTAGCDGKFYVFGGDAAGSITGQVQVYDPAANTWQSSP